jgi:hypothetical protein
MSDTSTSGQAPEPVMTETVRALVRRLSRTRREFAEVMPCTWCNNIGVVPEEAFGRDEDGAPMVDGTQPCPEGCEVPRWLQAERNDARDDAAQLARLQALNVAALLQSHRDLERVCTGLGLTGWDGGWKNDRVTVYGPRGPEDEEDEVAVFGPHTEHLATVPMGAPAVVLDTILRALLATDTTPAVAS